MGNTLSAYDIRLLNQYSMLKIASPAVADPEIVSGGGCGRSRDPLTTGKGSGEGAVPPPQNFFFNFGPQNGQFWCTVGAGGGMHPPGSATVPCCHVTYLSTSVIRYRKGVL